MAKILVVDDERAIRRALTEVLEFEKYKVEEAGNGIEALAKVKKGAFDVILLDIKMPQMDGMETLERIAAIAPDIPVIMISGHAEVDTAVEAVKKGAFDFLQKPMDLSRVLITVRNALDKSSLIVETKVLKTKVRKGKSQEIIGESDSIVEIKKTIDRVAATDARVLIIGDNGTGKELVARRLHRNSERKDTTLIEVNCAAIPSELIESELFGHEKGAFTSAHKQRIGKFEQANGGTLFLDEIGDMSLSAQAKVLRALQENRITRVGGEKEIKVDVRIIAATNKDLREEIKEKRFREDLFHRLAVIIINVPKLNERKDDIPLLADHFVKMICGEYGIAVKKITDGAKAALQEFDWSGNIRELRNATERLIILSDKEITEKDVKQYVAPNTSQSMNLTSLFEKHSTSKSLIEEVKSIYENWKSQ